MSLLALVPSCLPAQQISNHGYGPLFGYDVESDRTLLGGHVSFPLFPDAEAWRLQVQAIGGLGGLHDSFMANIESQYRFNRDGAIPFYLGLSSGYMFESGNDGSIAGLALGFERILGGGIVGLVRGQWTWTGEEDDLGLIFGIALGATRPRITYGDDATARE